MAEVTVEQVKVWFGISDEAIASKVQEEAAAVESQKQSLRDRIASLEAELAALSPVATEETVQG